MLASDEERRLGERGEVLRLAVAVLVRDVGGPRRDADREEREQRRDEVGARVQRLGDEPEAVGREADGRASARRAPAAANDRRRGLRGAAATCRER